MRSSVRRGARALLAVALAVTALVLAGPDIPRAHAAIPPIFTPSTAPAFGDDAPDPDLVRDGSTWYTFTTGTTWGNDLGVLISDQPGGNWHTKGYKTFGSRALAAKPAWVAESIAPGVFFWGGRWVMYYTARPAAGGHWCLSVATSPSPTTPFTDTSTGCWYADDANGGAVDPDPFIDADGRAWLVWKTTDGTSPLAARLFTAPLSADGLALTAPPTQILFQDDVPYAGFETIENPQMVRNGTDYYLFFSQGRWESAGYRTGYAVCSTVIGPCTAAPTPVLESSGGVLGPGGATLATDADGQWWMAYHAWSDGCASYSCGGARRLYTTPVSFDIRVPCTAPSSPFGYRLVAADGGIFSFGNLPFCGSTGALSLASPVVGAASTKTGGGYWLLAADGGIFSFGDAGFHGSTGGLPLNQPIVAMTPSPSGNGYRLVARDGGIFSFGDATFHGSTGGLALNRPVVGMASAPSGQGYWLVASDGGIFAFGDAVFRGSTGATPLNRPIVGMATTPTGNGYWLVASDGGIFAFGDAAFFGSAGAVALNRPIVALATG